MIVLAQGAWQTGLILGALALVIGWVLLRTYRRLPRQRREEPPLVEVSRPEEAEQGHHLEAPPEVVRWEVEMHETARALSAQLDSKIGALRALIGEADRAAARLEAARGGSADDGPQTEGEEALGQRRPGTQAEALRASGESDLSTTRAQRWSPRRSGRPSPEEVYGLADGGLGSAEIARRLGMPVGEIELVLGLREKG
jgi:hypothetical protein